MGRRHQALGNRRWERARRATFIRDGYRCAACGVAARLECDHERPLARGGDPFDPKNLQTLCVSCHRRKTARENGREPTPAERAWRQLVKETQRETQGKIAR